MIYTNYTKLAMTGGVALLTDTIKVALMSPSYVPDVESEYIGQLVLYEVSTAETGYSRKTLTGKDVFTITNGSMFTADDVQWADATFEARYAVVFKDTGSDSSSPLIAYIDLGPGAITNHNPFDLAISENAGIMQLNAV